MKRILCLLLCMCTIFAQLSIVPINAQENIRIIEDTEVSDSGEIFKFQYSGTWKFGTTHHELFSNGDEHYSDTIGDYFTVKFYGTGIDIYGSLNKNHGTYSVEVDGVAYDDINAITTGNAKHQQLLSSIKDLDNKEHTLKVTNKGPKSIQVDYVKVYYGDIPASDVEILTKDIEVEVDGKDSIKLNLLPNYAISGTVTFASQNNEIVTVDENGIVTGKALGNAVVDVLLNGNKVKEVNVRVVEEVDTFNITLADQYLLESDEDYSKIILNNDLDFNEIAWKNDVVSSKIAIFTKSKEAHNISVSVSDFVSKDHKISKDNIKAQWLRNVDAYIGKGTTISPMKSFPDVISHETTHSLSKNSLGFVWVEMYIPKDTIPGTYTGTVSFKEASSKKIKDIQYTIEVIDLELPDEVMTDVQIWQHPFSQAGYLGLEESEYFSQEHFDYMRSSMIEYAKMGSRDLVANIVDEAWGHQSYFGDATMVAWTKKTDGTFTFDYTMYEQWVNFAIECGVIDPINNIGKIKCYSIVPWSNRITYFDEETSNEVTKNLTVGSSEWTTIWSQFLESFVDYSVEKGWFDITYIAMDERPISALTPTVDLIESITNDDGESLKIFCACNYYALNYQNLTDRIDDISIGLKHISHTNDEFRQFSAHRRELGLDTTIYTCTGDYPGNFLISDPADNYWLMWYTMTQQADGYLKWAWDNWVLDPLNSPNYKSWEPGDGWYIYPVEKENIGEVNFYSTPRYEMMKEGIRDIKKAKYLMEQSDDLNTIISNLVASMDRGERGSNGYGSATYANQNERMITVNESKRMNEAINDIAYQYVVNDGEVVYKGNLEAFIKEAELIDLDYYTKETADQLTAALQHAKEVFENTNASKDDVVKAETLLSEAIKGLVKFDITTTWPALDENTLINTMENKDKVVAHAFSSECNESMEGAGLGTLAATLDYNESTHWHSDYENNNGEKHWLVYDLKESYTITDLRLLPRQTGNAGNGDILKLEVYVSDTDTFTKDNYINDYEFDNDGSILTSRDFHRIYLGDNVKGRYVKIVVTHCGGSQMDQYASMSEIRFYGSNQVVVVDKNALNKVIVEVENTKADDYTKESYGVFAEALEAAKVIAEKEDVTQDDINEALTALEDAYKALVKKPVEKTFPFTDVSDKQWYYGVINEAYQLGLMTGASDTLFKPNANMNRGMVAIVFHRMEGSKKVEYSSIFPDVANKQYYTTSVLWAKQTGVINGYKDGTFKPLRNVSREEMATMIYNFARYKGLDMSASKDITYFSDYAKITPYARVTLQWAVEKGLMSGKDNGTRLDPLGTATRAECSKMLVQAYKVIYK